MTPHEVVACIMDGLDPRDLVAVDGPHKVRDDKSVVYLRTDENGGQRFRVEVTTA